MESVNNALLLADLPNLNVPYFLGPAISEAASLTHRRLTIILFSSLFSSDSSVSHTKEWNNIQRLLTFVYVQATKVTQEMDKVLMDVDVLLRSPSELLLESVYEEVDLIFQLNDHLPYEKKMPALSIIPRKILADKQNHPPRENVQLESDVTPHQPSVFPVVAMGGTFDHLHAGHKILLSMAAWITSSKLIVGVTDDSLLQKKQNIHVLEDISHRTTRTRRFLELFKPDIKHDIVPITDVYGPTGWDPDIQALVVSKETMSGAKSIASHREQKNLPKLQTFIIDVISATSASLDADDEHILKQAKMSSTYIREWIVANPDKATALKA